MEAEHREIRGEDAAVYNLLQEQLKLSPHLNIRRYYYHVLPLISHFRGWIKHGAESYFRSGNTGSRTTFNLSFEELLA